MRGGNGNGQVMGIGIDELVAKGLLDHLRAGPLYWVDVADSQPCIGTGGIVAWQLKVRCAVLMYCCTAVPPLYGCTSVPLRSARSLASPAAPV